MYYEIVVQSFIKQTINFQWELSALEDIHETKSENQDIVEGVQIIKFSPMVFAESVINKWWPHGYGSQPLYTAAVRLTLRLNSP